MPRSAALRTARRPRDGASPAGNAPPCDAGRRLATCRARGATGETDHAYHGVCRFFGFARSQGRRICVTHRPRHARRGETEGAFMAKKIVTPNRIKDESALARGTDMMKAIVQHTYGVPQAVLALQDTAKPVVKDDEVLVRIRAASIHVGDWILVRGVPYVLRLASGLRTPKNRVPG